MELLIRSWRPSIRVKFTNISSCWPVTTVDWTMTNLNVFSSPSSHSILKNLPTCCQSVSLMKISILDKVLNSIIKGTWSQQFHIGDGSAIRIRSSPSHKSDFVPPWLSIECQRITVDDVVAGVDVGDGPSIPDDGEPTCGEGSSLPSSIVEL